MQNGALSINGLKTRDHTPLITKIGLLLVFLLGIGVIVLGYRGIQEYNASGFSSETAYHAIYALSGDVNAAWEKKLQPQMNALSAEKRETLDEAVEVLRGIWEKAHADPESMHRLPLTTPIRRPDEVAAARSPRIRYDFQAVGD